MNTYKVIGLEHLTANTYCLRTERPSVLIKSGQCFNVGVPGLGINREYSMYSSADAPYLEFLIKEVDGGLVSPVLKRLEIGSLVEIDGPYGEFCLRPPIDPAQKYLFLATGTGIAPFHSFVKTFGDLNYTILHGVRHSAEQYHANDYAAGRYIPCISKNNSGQPSFRLTDYLTRFPVDPLSIVYLCGNRNMIIDAFEILRDQGVPGDNLYTEVFF